MRKRQRYDAEARRWRTVAVTVEATVVADWTQRVAAGYVPTGLVTRAHQCNDCGAERCITEHRLTAYDVSHYECNCCGSIYDTFSRVPWKVPRL